MKDVNRKDLVRVDSQNNKDGLTLVFKFRKEISHTDEAGLKHRFDTEESIEVTIGKTLEEAKTKLAAVVSAIDNMMIEGD